MRNNSIQEALIDVVREKANTKDCKECKFFYLDKDSTPVCSYVANNIDECIVVKKQLNLVP